MIRNSATGTAKIRYILTNGVGGAIPPPTVRQAMKPIAPPTTVFSARKPRPRQGCGRSARAFG